VRAKTREKERKRGGEGRERERERERESALADRLHNRSVRRLLIFAEINRRFDEVLLAMASHRSSSWK